MVRIIKILLCGASGVGKTNAIQCLGCNIPVECELNNNFPTYEDTFTLLVETEKGVKEKVRIYEIGGTQPKIGRHFINSCDGAIVMFDRSQFSSFEYAKKLKCEIDQLKDKHDVPIVLVANKIDIPRDPKFEVVSASAWAQSEKIGFFETDTKDYNSLTLMLLWLLSRILQPSTASLEHYLTSISYGKFANSSHVHSDQSNASNLNWTQSETRNWTNPAKFLAIGKQKCTIRYYIRFELKYSLSPTFTVPLLGPKDPSKKFVEAASVGISLAAFNSASFSTCFIFVGHMDGCISVSNFGQRRQILSWLAHPPNGQVIGLAIHNWSSSNAHHLISQGRDGHIKFWPFDELTVPTSTPTATTEVTCCDFTFCPFAVWDSYLAYVSMDTEHVSDLSLEVIRSSDNLTICHIDTTQISKLGMCMALSGVSSPSQPACIFLAGFEASCVVLFSNGKALIKVTPNNLGEIRPITCLAVNPIQFRGVRLVAVGMTAVGETSKVDNATSDLVLLQLDCSALDEHSLTHFTQKNLRKAVPPSSLGASSLSWRCDGRLLVVGQWNGDLRLLTITHKSDENNLRVKCLGRLESPGAEPAGGRLLGDWKSISSTTTVKNKDEDQTSLSVRACCFLASPSNWLISTAPASASGSGSFNVWDVYRDV